jgi:hypothetical protein
MGAAAAVAIAIGPEKDSPTRINGRLGSFSETNASNSEYPSGSSRGYVTTIGCTPDGKDAINSEKRVPVPSIPGRRTNATT